jgi:hypothetical protein
MRDRAAAELGPLAFAAKDLPPMEVRLFRWWEDELADIKTWEADDDEVAAPGKGRVLKKRSISDLLFAAAPPVDPSGSSGASKMGEDDDEVLGAIMRRSKELRRRRREEAEAAAAAAAAEPSSAGEAREREANSARQVCSSPARPGPTQPSPLLRASMTRLVCVVPSAVDFLVTVLSAWIDLPILHHYDSRFIDRLGNGIEVVRFSH